MKIKTITKRKKVFSVFPLIFVLASLVLFCAFPANAQHHYTPMEKIPGFEDATDFPSYLLAITKFALWTVGIAALFMISWGGFMYMTSAGNTSRVESAKKIILDALFGLLIALGAWLLLFVVNPDLVKVNLALKPVVTGKIPLSPSEKPLAPPSPGTQLRCEANAELSQTTKLKECINQKAKAANVTIGSVKTFQGEHTCDLSVPKISCHFGGRYCNGYANAIDYGGPPGDGGGQDYARLVLFAKECGAHAARCEDSSGKTKGCFDRTVDHIHVTVLGSCGCN